MQLLDCKKHGTTNKFIFTKDGIKICYECYIELMESLNYKLIEENTPSIILSEVKQRRFYNE